MLLKLLICNFVLIIFLTLSHAQMNLIENAPIPPPNFNAISKLRALFFPEFYKKFEKPTKLEVICSGSISLDISTKNCNCSKYVCSKNSQFLR